jgi:lipoprotein-releasing system permease protein
MNRQLTWQLAIRYLRGKRSLNAVPVLSRISMVAIGVVSAAMIITFSVFNGFEHEVKSLYKAFYPDIRITVARGKFFPASAITGIAQIKGVEFVSPVIEDNALAGDLDNVSGSANRQKVITVKGIENNYFKVNDVTQYIDAGVDTVSDTPRITTIAGRGIAQELGADVNNVFSSIMLYYPNPDVTNPEADPLNAYQSLKMHPAGLFTIGNEFDDKYILAPINKVQELFHAQGMYSSIELKVAPGAAAGIKEQLQKKLGDKYKVETRFEQNKTVYTMVAAEKWVTYVILVFVLVIASFNMVGALSMLVIEKKKDIAILKAMGTEASAIRNVFLLEAVLWACVGGVSGLALGSIISLVQQKFGIIKLQGAFVVDAYPVKVHITDIIMVTITIIAVGLMAGWYPALRASKSTEFGLKST